MSDYVPLVINEKDVRNFVSPPLDYDDVYTAEILLKIEVVEAYVKHVYFGGSGPPATARVPIILLVIVNLLSNPTLARKYSTLSSEKLGSYSYSLAEPIARGTDIQSSPFIVQKTWQNMAIEMLERLASPSDYQIRVVNE